MACNMPRRSATINSRDLTNDTSVISEKPSASGVSARISALFPSGDGAGCGDGADVAFIGLADDDTVTMSAGERELSDTTPFSIRNAASSNVCVPVDIFGRRALHGYPADAALPVHWASASVERTPSM